MSHAYASPPRRHVPARFATARLALYVVRGGPKDRLATARLALYVGRGGPKDCLLHPTTRRVGNAVGHANRSPSDEDFRDCPLTALGEAQAATWAEVAPEWRVEAVLVSPMCRALQTAGLVFREDTAPTLALTPEAREGWWSEEENRGRLLSGLLAGSETGAPDEPKRWPALAELACLQRFSGLEAVAAATTGWDPVAEAAPEPGDELLDDWAASLDRLAARITAHPSERLAVVCHWGVINRLLGVSAPNCGLVEARWWGDGDGEREVCGISAPDEAAVAALLQAK